MILYKLEATNGTALLGFAIKYITNLPSSHKNLVHSLINQRIHKLPAAQLNQVHLFFTNRPYQVLRSSYLDLESGRNQAHSIDLERVTGIEPVSKAWQAFIITIILHPHIRLIGAFESRSLSLPLVLRTI